MTRSIPPPPLGLHSGDPRLGEQPESPPVCLPPHQVWATLQPFQRQRVLQALTRVCRALLTPQSPEETDERL
ncbi:MAG TPA: hypothetical protein VGN26_12195 [Armatimonadota bacterium]|jgi:hypothetical protein